MILKNLARSTAALITLLLFMAPSFTPVLAAGEPLSSNTASSAVVKRADAAFSFPQGLAFSEALDAVIVADTQNHRICSLDLKTQKVTTIAGISLGQDRFGFPGGGYVDGDIDQAMFNLPRAVAVADNGAIFVADTGNHAIRQIYQGKVSTIAGGMLAGYKDGKSTEASFLSPSAILLDGRGNIFVSDTLNDVIRKIDSFGNVTTYAGSKNDKSLLNEPAGLALDKNGRLYVADSGNHQIKRISTKDKIETMAGLHFAKDEASGYWNGGYKNGYVDAALFNFPKGITIKEDGAILVADTYNHVVREIKDSQVYTVAGAGVAGKNPDDKYLWYFDGPSAILYAKETLFIADQWNNRVIMIPDAGQSLSAIYLEEQPAEEISVYLESRKVTFPNVQPLILEDQVRIPLRPLAAALGAELQWNQEKKLATLLWQGKSAEFSWEAGDILLYQGHSMTSLDRLAGKLNLHINWLYQLNVVSIETN